MISAAPSGEPRGSASLLAAFLWPRSARRRWALGLWILLAIIVFNVTFDWQTRMAGHAFVGTQIERRHNGQAPLTINEGYRPLVRQAAVQSSLWLVLIAGGGIAMVAATSRNNP